MRTKVQRGQCIHSIAAEEGHVSQTVWSDPANKHLSDTAALPFILPAGQSVEIPALRSKKESVATDTRHRIRRIGSVMMLRLKIMDDDKPWANKAYVLELEHDELEGMTDGQGLLETRIPAGLKTARLKFSDSDEPIALELGALQPSDTISGVQARLNNLGFPAGPIDGLIGPKTRKGLNAFRRANKIDESSEIDESTQSKLAELHGT